jgi:hypothetical protein
MDYESTDFDLSKLHFEVEQALSTVLLKHLLNVLRSQRELINQRPIYLASVKNSIIL